MKKRIVALLTAVILCSPCLLIINENMNWWNVVGVAWLWFLAFGGMRYLVPTWMWKELQQYCQERDDEDIFKH